MEKVEVNGDAAAPIYQWLKSQKKQLMMERIKWNFGTWGVLCEQNACLSSDCLSATSSLCHQPHHPSVNHTILNTEKFLIDCRQEPPVVVNRYASTTTPESIAKDVAKLLSS